MNNTKPRLNLHYTPSIISVIAHYILYIPIVYSRVIALPVGPVWTTWSAIMLEVPSFY